MVADEGYKSAAFQHLCGEFITEPLNESQLLMFRIPHGQNHPASFCKLSKERLRNGRGGRGNDDGVERSEVRQAGGSLAAMDKRVPVTQPSKRRGSTGSNVRPA